MEGGTVNIFYLQILHPLPTRHGLTLNRTPRISSFAPELTHCSPEHPDRMLKG